MEKESETQKQTNRLLAILGDNPHRRARHFLIGVVVIGALVGPIIYKHSTAVKDEGTNIRYCDKIRDTYISTLYGVGESNADLEATYRKCAAQMSTTLEKDKDFVCNDTFKNRYWGELPKVTKRRVPEADKLIIACKDILKDKIPRIKAYLEDSIEELNEEIKDYQTRKDILDNARDSHIKDLEYKKESYAERLLSVRKLEG